MSDSSTSDSDDADQLSNTLITSMVKSSFEKTPHKFVPQKALDKIITRDSVLKAMKITRPTKEDDELVEFVLNKAKAIFATAADSEFKSKSLKKVMELFQKNNFDDRKLPIEKWSSDEFYDNPAKGIRHPFASMDKLTKNGYGKMWTLRKIYEFQEAQSKFLVPIFSTAESNYDLGELTVPFVGKHTRHSEGAFGIVSKYEIHCDHIKDPSRPVRERHVAIDDPVVY